MKKISARKKKWIERMAANERRYRPYLYSRLWILITLIFAQVALCLCSVYLLVYDSRVGVTLQVGLGIVELIILLYLINKNERSSMRWSWIILILVVPIIGVPSYLLYGDGRPTKRMKRLLEKAKAENEKCFREVCGEGEETSDLRADGIGRYLITYANYPIYMDGEM